MKKKLESNSPLRAASCSPSSDVRQCGEVTISRNGYIEQVERERDEARRLHAYANAQRKAADNERMNAEETVARLRLKVGELLQHGLDACEYTDGWEDALLKVRNEFPPENDKGMAVGRDGSLPAGETL